MSRPWISGPWELRTNGLKRSITGEPPTDTVIEWTDCKHLECVPVNEANAQLIVLAEEMAEAILADAVDHAAEDVSECGCQICNVANKLRAIGTDNETP